MNIEIRDISKKWFSEALPVNYKEATATIDGEDEKGSLLVKSRDNLTCNTIITVKRPQPASIDVSLGEDKKITITMADMATQASLVIEAGTGVDEDTVATFDNNVLTVTLGTDANGDADATKNVSATVVEEINKITGFTATSTGDGTEAISPANSANFTYIATNLDVSYANNNITITLASVVTTGALDSTKNLAVNISELIDLIDGFYTVLEGDESEVVIGTESAEIEFEDGHYGTPSQQAYIALNSNGTYYMCTEADMDKDNTNWVKFTLETY